MNEEGPFFPGMPILLLGFLLGGILENHPPIYSHPTN